MNNSSADTSVNTPRPSGALGARPINARSAPPELNNALLNKYGLPRRFTWRGEKHHVQKIGGHWYRRGRWWQDEPERHFFRVITTAGITLDLCHDPGTGKWSIAMVHD